MKIKNHCRICKAINCHSEFLRHPSTTSYIAMKQAVTPIVRDIRIQIDDPKAKHYNANCCEKHTAMPLEEAGKLNSVIQEVSRPFHYKETVDRMLGVMARKVG